jgi:hypothetical protein
LCSTSRIVSANSSRKPADDAHQIERLLRIHAGRWLVEQQQRGSVASARAISSRRWLP